MSCGDSVLPILNGPCHVVISIIGGKNRYDRSMAVIDGVKIPIAMVSRVFCVCELHKCPSYWPS